MRKSTLFISATLTVFLLATAFGVVSAYQNLLGGAQPEAVAATASTVETLPSEVLMSVAPTGVVSPEEATALAMQMIGRDDVYSVASVIHEGSPAYLVTFSSGDLVYVSPLGQILAITELEPVVVVVPLKRDRDNGDDQGGGGGGEHEEREEDHEDHEEHEDDD